MSQVNITTNTSKVEVNTTNNQIVVTNPVNPNTVSITQPVTTVVEVITAGPQGPPGLIPSTGSFVTTSSFNAFTSSYNTGSFTGSFTGSLFGTSSYAASIGTLNQNVNITGSLNISGSITATGNQTTIGYLLVGSGSANNTPNYGAAPNVVVGMNTGTAGAVLELRNTSQSILAGTTLGTIQFTADGSGGVYSSTQIRSTVTTSPGTGASGGGNLLFLTAPSTSGGIVERMRINSSGNVGIGTITPNAKLDVSGSVNISGSLLVTGSITVVGNILPDTDNTRSIGTGTQGLNLIWTRTVRSNSTLEFYPGGVLAATITTGGNLLLGTTTPTGKLSVLDTTLASGSANAGSLLDLQQTWNTTGTPSAIKLNVTNANSNANSRLIDLQIGGIPQFYVTSFSVYANRFSAPEFRASTDATMLFGTANISTQTKYVDIATGTLSQPSGINSAVSISPIYNQVTSTAANTDLKVNRTETSVGSGTQLLMDLQVGGVSKFNVTTNGTATAYGGIYTSIISDAFSTNNSRINFGGSSKYIAFNTNNTEAVRISSNQNLLLGTTTDSGFKLDVNGTSRHTGDTTITGSLLVTGSTTVAGNIVPSANTTYDLGSVSNNFNSIRTNQVVFAGGQLQLNSSATSGVVVIKTNSVEAMRISAAQNILLGTTTDDNTNILQVSGSVRITDGLTVTGSLLVTGSTTVTGNIAPSANNIYDLGSSTNNFLRVRANNIVSNVGSLSIWVQHTSGAPEIARFHNNTGNLALQPSGSTFVDDGINRLQVSGSARITNGLTVTGSTSINGTTQGFIFTDTVNATSSFAIYPKVVPTNANYLVRTDGSNLLLNSPTNALFFRIAGASFGQFSATTGNFLLQNGGIFTDDTVNRLQVSGSARITNGLTVTGSLVVSSSAGMTVDGINIGRGGGYNSSNTIIGNSAGLNNSTGGSNTFIGYLSGQLNNNGSQNTFIGQNAGGLNTSGNNNTNIGVNAGYANTSGGSNIFLGRDAGRWITDKVTSATITNTSIMLGYRTSPLGDSQTNQIVIGYDSTGLGSNTTVLGNSSTVTTAIYGDLLLGTTSDSGTEKLQVVGNTKIVGQTTLSGSQNTASGSILKVIGSGSQQPIFTVLGSQGELFSITDSLSGSLFSVNDISGLPILEVFSDNTTLIGNYQAPALVTTAKNVLASAGAFTVYSLPTASYDGAFFEYTARSGSNARAGQIMAIWSGSAVNYTETTSSAFGTTTGLTLGVFITGSNMALTGSATTSAWTIKTIIRSI